MKCIQLNVPGYTARLKSIPGRSHFVTTKFQISVFLTFSRGHQWSLSHHLPQGKERGRRRQRYSSWPWYMCTATWHLSISLQQRYCWRMTSHINGHWGPPFCHATFLLYPFEDGSSPLKSDLFTFDHQPSFFNIHQNFFWMKKLHRALFSPFLETYIFPTLALSGSNNINAYKDL